MPSINYTLVPQMNSSVNKLFAFALSALLLLDPRQEGTRLERLRRLRFGPVQHPHHHNARRMDVQRQLELRVLGLILRLACDLLSARLRVRTQFVCIHMLVDVPTVLRVRQLSCHLSIGMTPILVTGDADRNKVQTMPGGNSATIEIKLPANWNELMAKIGYRPLEEFFLSQEAPKRE